MGLLDRLRGGLTRTREVLNTPIEDLVRGRRPLDADALDAIEEALLAADMGLPAVSQAMEVLREQSTGHDSVRDFLASIDRRLIAQEQALPGDGVQLATFHAAKGLEFDAVLVIGCEEGLVPYAKAISEAELESERRSFYVALTRARDHEVLLSCAERSGRRTPPSRFLRDLPLDAIQTERRATYG